MNIETLVPPLELCKLIPEGEFENSFFIYSYSCDKRITEPFLDRRDDTEYCRKNMVNAPSIYPAPTLQEILKELDEFEVWGNNISDEHTVVSEFVQYEDENTATAALKVWLKLKGIKA